jgi:hypothetical protein
MDCMATTILRRLEAALLDVDYYEVCAMFLGLDLGIFERRRIEGILHDNAARLIAGIIARKNA